MNTDGTDIEPFPSTSLVGGLALDLSEGKFYWVTPYGTSSHPSLHRSNLDGSGAENVPITEGAEFVSSPSAGFTLNARRPGDCTGDRVLDLDDFVDTTTCLNGPESKFLLGCSCADSDGDGKVSLRDFAAFQREFPTP